MLINEFAAVGSHKVTLVPYTKAHVAEYHEWMKDHAIQAATASEPLTLEEEYAMQESWRKDADKLTFIITRPSSACGEDSDGSGSGSVGESIGDVNLFISLNEEEGRQVLVGELELMIAKREKQRRGYGKAAVLVFLMYILRNEERILKEYAQSEKHEVGKEAFNYFAVKIGMENERSVKLFESLGFTKVLEEVNYFGEFELRAEGMTSERVGKMLEKHDVREYREMRYAGPT